MCFILKLTIISLCCKHNNLKLYNCQVFCRTKTTVFSTRRVCERKKKKIVFLLLLLLSQFKSCIFTFYFTTENCFLVSFLPLQFIAYLLKYANWSPIIAYSHKVRKLGNITVLLKKYVTTTKYYLCNCNFTKVMQIVGCLIPLGFMTFLLTLTHIDYSMTIIIIINNSITAI